MTVQVSLEPEHITSLEFALDALKAEQAVCKRWGVESVRHRLTIDDIEEILERARQADVNVDRTNWLALVEQIGRSKPW